MTQRIPPPDGGLGEPKRRFEDTFSAADAILNEFLARRLEGPLPQRVLDPETNEKADEFRVSFSRAEVDHLIRMLRR